MLFPMGLKRARESSEMSQERLATEMVKLGFEFHQTTVNKIENGKRKVSIGEAAALSSIVQTPLEVMVQPQSSASQSLDATFKAMDHADHLLKSLGVLNDDLGGVVALAKRNVEETIRLASEQFGPESEAVRSSIQFREWLSSIETETLRELLDRWRSRPWKTSRG